MKITSQYCLYLCCLMVCNLVGLGIVALVHDSLNRHRLYALSIKWLPEALTSHFCVPFLAVASCGIRLASP